MTGFNGKAVEGDEELEQMDNFAMLDMYVIQLIKNNKGVWGAKHCNQFVLNEKEEALMEEVACIDAEIKCADAGTAIGIVNEGVRSIDILLQVFPLQDKELNIYRKAPEMIKDDEKIVDAGLFWSLYEQVKIEAMMDPVRIRAVTEIFGHKMQSTTIYSIGYKFFNKCHEDYNYISTFENDDFSDVAIVIQGPIKYNFNYTYESVMQYFKMYPNIEIVLSTWKTEGEDERFQQFREIEKLHVVLKEPPVNRGSYNVNLQSASVCNGIDYVRKNLPHVNYILRMRTDVRIYSYDALKLMRCLVNKSYKQTGEQIRGKIVCSPTPIAKKCEYYYFDQYNFGNIDDMANFWDREEIKGVETNGDEYSPENYPESALYYRYAKKYSRMPYEAGGRDVYTFLPVEVLDVEWNEYNYGLRLEYRSKISAHERERMQINPCSNLDIFQWNGWLNR